MKKVILTASLFIFLFGCVRVDTKSIEDGITRDFHASKGIAANSTTIIKTGDYQYTGVVELEDGSKANILVLVDRDNTDKYIWSVTMPTESMIRAATQKALYSTPGIDTAMLRYMQLSPEEQRREDSLAAMEAAMKFAE